MCRVDGVRETLPLHAVEEDLDKAPSCSNFVVMYKVLSRDMCNHKTGAGRLLRGGGHMYNPS